MEFCGGHTHAISRYGIADLLPANVRMIHGPGCPVCVLPIGRVDQAIRLAREHGVILCTYADTVRVPASDNLSLMRAKAQGCRCAHDLFDAGCAEDRARQSRSAKWCSSPSVSRPPRRRPRWRSSRRAAEGLKNFSILCDHVLTPAAMHAILAVEGGVALDGFVGPAHVSTVIGSKPYEPFADDYGKPVVIAGFEPLDVMQAILMLVRQVNDGRAEVENEFTRAVTREGNLKAQELVAEVFELRDMFEWRGLGSVPQQRVETASEVRRLRCRTEVQGRLRRRARQQSLRMRRDFERPETPAGVQDIRHGVHAGEPGRFVHGVVGGRVCGALQLRQIQGNGMMVHEKHEAGTRHFAVRRKLAKARTRQTRCCLVCFVTFVFFVDQLFSWWWKKRQER